MKTKIVLVLNLLMMISSVYAQRVMITNDSLRNHFRNEELYEVYDYYQRRFDDNLDYKALYYDQEMKDYLMKWLDPDVWIDYKLFLYKKELYQRFNYRPESRESFINYYVENDLKLKYDSIRSDTSLVNLYLNQAIEKRINEERNMMTKKKSDIIPPQGVLYLHSRVAYPEFYKIIKQWWYQQDKQVFLNDYDITEIMICLLALNDPEAQSIFNNVLKRFFTSDWHPFFGTGTLESLRFVSNAYAVKKLLEILPVKKEIVTTSDGSTEPFDKLTYKLLRQFMIEHNLENNPFQSINDDITEMRKNQDKIIEASERLIKKMEQEEKYWMDNMPFDYTPKIQ